MTESNDLTAITNPDEYVVESPSDAGETRIVITPETGGYDISAIDASGIKVKTTWGYDRDNALLKANEMANYYRGYHNQSADIVWK